MNKIVFTSISLCFSKAFPIAVAASSLIVLPSRRNAFNGLYFSISLHNSLTRIYISKKD
jgi:hypothetical protein